MRRAAPTTRPVGLTIAGSDSGAGAGIQADIKTMEALGIHATSVITAVTAQNTQGVTGSHVLPVGDVADQLGAIKTDFDLDVIKTGMLATDPIIGTVTRNVRDLDVPIVVDPVMVAASGDRLLEESAEDAYEELIAEATLVTPNADEATVLTGVDVVDIDSAQAAGEALLEMGVEAALLKGGHVPGELVQDVLVTDETMSTYSHERIEEAATHGSGCTLASAIAARLACGEELSIAVGDAISLLTRAVRYYQDVGSGEGAVHHLVGLRTEAERTPTVHAVETIVQEFVEMDVSPLVPEVGMNVVGATPYAETVGETAAVDGRISRTLTGVKPTGSVRFGASSHVARFLLAARQYEPSFSYAVNCRYDEDIEAALDAQSWPVASYDRSDQPETAQAREGGTMGWAAETVYNDVERPPVAVIDRGAHGKEPMVKVLASDPGTLVDRIETLQASL